MKFLVPNYSCLQNSWLGGYRPQIPVLSVLCPQLNLLNTPPPNKIPGYATDCTLKETPRPSIMSLNSLVKVIFLKTVSLVRIPLFLFIVGHSKWNHNGEIIPLYPLATLHIHTFLFQPTTLLGPRNIILAQFSSGIPIRQYSVTADRESATEQSKVRWEVRNKQNSMLL